MVLPPKILKKLILETNLLSEEDFDNTLKEAKRIEKNPIDLLISRGFITRDFYADIIAKHLNVPRIKLIGMQIPTEILNI